MEYSDSCVAGITCKLSGFKPSVNENRCAAKAAKLLDISTAEADRLFFEYYKVDEPKFHAAWKGGRGCQSYG
jgi:hypothetical protein